MSETCLLSFLLARDTMHQNQWLAAVEELKADGLEKTPCPSNFPQELEAKRFSYQYLNFSKEPKAGREPGPGAWRRMAKASSSVWPSRRLMEKSPSWTAGPMSAITARPKSLKWPRQPETHARSKRSRFMTLFHTAMKSFTNFCWESSQA